MKTTHPKHGTYASYYKKNTFNKTLALNIYNNNKAILKSDPMAYA